MTSTPADSNRRDRRTLAAARLGLFVLAIALAAATSLGRASAADSDDDSWLRGSFSDEHRGPIRWDGVVLGGTFGFSNMSTDFGDAAGPEVAYILRNSTLETEDSPSSWTTLPRDITNSQQYGAFIGYNYQLDQIVLGADIAYNHPNSLVGSASDSIDRIVTTSDGVTHNVLLQAQSSLRLVDYGTVRARAGYGYGQFLPYGMLGVAVGRFNYSTSATVTDVQSGAITGTFGPITQTQGQDNFYATGFVAGLGLDVSLLPNVFVRGEWETIVWGPVNGIKPSMNTARVGLGVRF